MSNTAVWHKVWHFGNDVDTDALAPGAYMQHGIEVIAAHCLENLDPSFAAGVRPGDVVVAGKNFGIGSSREQAAAALVHLGVRAVIAQSYGGLFFRNAFNLGLTLLTCAETPSLQHEDRIAIVMPGILLNLPSGQELHCEPVPDFLLHMAQAGGLVPSLRRRMANAAGKAHA